MRAGILQMDTGCFKEKYMFLIITGIILVLGMVLFAVMLYDSNRFVIVNYQVRSSKIRQKTRAVLLADLHNKEYGHQNFRLLDAVDAAGPDIILCAGDMITSVEGISMVPAQEFVQTLAEKYPFYYANGNHEHRIYRQPDDYGMMGEQYRGFLKSCDIVLLENERILLPDRGIEIIGLDLPKCWYKKFKTPLMTKKEIESIVKIPQSNTFSILLAHNPVYFDAYAAWGADLVLSGHVHGGVMRLPFLGGVLSTAFTLFPKYDGGLFEKSGSRMIVSRGLGSHTIPVRVFNPAELVVIDILPEE